MNLGSVLTSVCMVVGVTVLVRQSVLIWTGSSRFHFFHSTPPGLPMSLSLWKHYIRALPVFALAGLFFAATAVVAAVANGVGTVVLGLCTAVLVVGVAPMVILFNRPKRAVPPHLRAQVGYLAGRHR